MRSASGKYRLNAVAADFFECPSIRLIARGSSLLGRFGRLGTIHGSIESHAARCVWRDQEREGWMTLVFDEEYKTASMEYGTADGPAVARCTLERATRTTRPAEKTA